MSILGPSWKTTIGGILSAVGFAMRKHPATAPWSDLVQEVGIGIGLLAARDNNVTSEQAGAAKGPSIPVSVKMMILFLSVSLFSGCARFVGQTETRADGTSITRFRAYTLFDSKSELTKVIVRQTTTNKLSQSFGIQQATQESSGSNIVSTLTILKDAAGNLILKP